MDCPFPTATDAAALFSGIGDFLRAIAWPGAVAGFVYLFRTNIRGVLDRVIVQLSPSGAAIAPPPQPETTTKEGGIALDAATITPTAIDPFADDPALKHWRDHVVAQVQELGNVDCESLKGRLISSVAIQSRYAFFYNVLRSIYGSQIELLARARPTASLPVAEARAIHEDLHVLRAGGIAGALPFDRWLAFLIYHKLILPLTSPSDWTDEGTIIASHDGVEFAKFLVDVGETSNTRLY